MRKNIFCVLLFFVSFSCFANDNNNGKNKYDPFELELINLNLFYGLDMSSVNNLYGLGFGLIYIGESVDEDKMSRYFETGLMFDYCQVLSEFSLYDKKILQIRPYIHYGLIGYYIILGASIYCGLSGVFTTDFNSSSFGISPVIGFSAVGLGIFITLQLQYDFNTNKDYNCFLLCALISIPLNIWK
jgi:hypothetical protein